MGSGIFLPVPMNLFVSLSVNMQHFYVVSSNFQLMSIKMLRSILFSQGIAEKINCNYKKIFAKGKEFRMVEYFCWTQQNILSKVLKEYWLKLINGKYSIIRLFLEGVTDTKLPFWGNFEFTLTSTENQGEKSCEIHIQQTR